MPIASIERLLKNTIGLDVASIGAPAVNRAISERQHTCHLKTVHDYARHVRESCDELQELVEAVVVPETWFFRDHGAFDALGRIAHEWMLTHPGRVMRLLSVPCATGEEPYSMAMALLDHGIPPERFWIDAADVSERGLARARRGVYGRGAFRGADTGFRDRHFTPTPHGHLISPGIRQCVQFHRGSLVSPQFMAGVDPFDVIFCRNLLIYFDRETQARAVGTLERLLAPRGMLFVGSAESGVFADRAFSSARLPLAFAFRKGVGAATTVKPKPILAVPARPERRLPSPARAQSPAAPLVASAPPKTIADARLLADQGRFADAARCCEDLVQRSGPSAEAFYLLGLVRDASGNHADAGAYYRKALYLDPNHGEALVHLALLIETLGKPAEAAVLRNRMRRLESQRKA